MLDAALKDGTAHRRCTFELFGRRLPATRRFGVVAGTGRILEALERFEFDAEQIDWLKDQGIISEEAAQFLASWRFTGDIWGYAEGECYFPGSPLLTVEGTFADCTLLETLLLSILNHDCAVASAASRMTIAAHGRPCMDMGARRAHERAAVSAARAAIIGGFQGTSDLEAAKRYGIRCIGTAAHAFTLLHDTERDAFDSQVAKLGAGTTLLVDTYDIRQGVINAVEAARAAGGELGAVRLDSGDLVAEAFKVRGQLDAMGATTTKITVTSDLDEYAIAALGAVLLTDPGAVGPAFTGLFMEKMVGFVKLYFPVFLRGAVFGKLIELSGFSRSIVAAAIRILGRRHAIPVIVLVCALLTYGGVSRFLVAFAVYPFAAELFRQSGIPKRLIPAPVALGAFSFTMDALPGTPQIQNIIPTSFFGTNAWAAPWLGLIGSLFIIIFGLLWLERQRRKAQARG